jgi:hypothetical protein
MPHNKPLHLTAARLRFCLSRRAAVGRRQVIGSVGHLPLSRGKASSSVRAAAAKDACVAEKSPLPMLAHEAPLSTRCADRADAVVWAAGAETSSMASWPARGESDEARLRPQRHEGKKEAIVALIASLRCARIVVPRAGRSEPGAYRGTPRESGEVALSPNSPSDAAPIGRGSLAGPLCNVGSLQKSVWHQPRGGTRDGTRGGNVRHRGAQLDTVPRDSTRAVRRRGWRLHARTVGRMLAGQPTWLIRCQRPRVHPA